MATDRSPLMDYQPEEIGNNRWKTLVTFLIILVLFEACIAWYLIEQFRENYLSGEDAFDIALNDAGYSRDDVRRDKIKLKTKQGTAWYVIEFETDAGTSTYRVDAETGAILNES